MTERVACESRPFFFACSVMEFISLRKSSPPVNRIPISENGNAIAGTHEMPDSVDKTKEEKVKFDLPI